MSWTEQRIIIDPTDVAQLQVNRTVGHETRKMLRRDVSAQALLSGQGGIRVLPEGCRFVQYRRAGSYDRYVVEQPPMVRPIRLFHKDATAWKNLVSRMGMKKYGLTEEDFHRTHFRLSFPYIVFIVTMTSQGIDGARMFYRTAPLSRLDDSLFCAGVPNLWEDHRICLGAHYPRGSRSQAAASVNAVIDHYWNARFNDHLYHQFKRYADRVPQLASVWEWEYFSQISADFVLEADWIPTPYTLGDYLRQLDQPSSATLFKGLVATAKTLPLLVNGKPIQQVVGELEISGSLSAVLDGRVIEPGNRLVATRDFLAEGSTDGVERGRSYEVECFYEPDGTGQRHLHLKGVASPVPFWAFSQVTFEENIDVVERVQVGEKTIMRGMYCRFKWTEHRMKHITADQWYRIIDVRQDADDDVCVRLRGVSEWVYLTYDGGTFYSELELEQAQLAENNTVFNCRGVSFRAGQVVRISQSIYPEIMPGTLQKILSLSKEGNVVSAMLEGFDAPIVLFEHRMCFEWNTVFNSYQLQPNVICLGKKNLHLPTGKILCTNGSRRVVAGSVFASAGFVRSTRPDAHLLDVDLLLPEANEPLAIIRKSEWVSEETWKSVSDVGSLGSLTFTRGMRLRFTTKLHNLVPEGTELTILCLEDSEDGLYLITECGIRLLLTKHVMELVELFGPDGDPVILPEDVLEHATIGVVGNQQVRTNAEVRYIGGADVPEWFSRVYNHSMTAVAIQDMSWGEYRVRFPCSSPNSEDESTVFTFHRSFLRVVERVVIERCFTLASQVFSTHSDDGNDESYVLDPSVLAEQLRWHGGDVVGTDCDNQSVRMGDFVAPLRSSFSRQPIPRALINRPGLVVNVANSSHGVPFVYILYGPDVSDQGCPVPHQTNGWDRLALHLKDKYHRIKLALVSDCRRVELLIQHKHVCALGEQVKIRSDLEEPEFGWGGANAEVVGVLTEISEDGVEVQFPSIGSWIGLLEEIEPVDIIELLPGQLVRVRTGVAHRYLRGAVLAEEVGTVVRCELDHVVVDFPSQEGWKGTLRELVLMTEVLEQAA